MSDTLRPETADQLLDTVKWAVSEKTPMEVVAGGSKRDFGRPMQTAATLDMSAMSGIDTYEPEEDNGIETTRYKLLEREDGMFHVTKK